MARRKHHKISNLPPELFTEVNKRLSEGHTYDAIVAYLKKMEHPVGKSSVCRYYKEWRAVGEKIKQAREQAKVVIDSLKDTKNTDIAEAAEQILFSMMTDVLITGQAELEDADPLKIANALANLQRVAIQREKMKAGEQTMGKGVTLQLVERK